MAMLKLDERTLTLNAIAGIAEEYTPSERAKLLAAQVTVLKAKIEKHQLAEQVYLESEIIPELQAIRKEVQDINEDRYPELKKVREQKEINGKSS